jgi:hypothetical protein
VVKIWDFWTGFGEGSGEVERELLGELFIEDTTDVAVEVTVELWVVLPRTPPFFKNSLYLGSASVSFQICHISGFFIILLLLLAPSAL